MSKVWCLGNCSQVDIVEPKMCMCAHVCGMHEHAYREVHGSVCVCVCAGVRLEMELERHARSGSGRELP